MPVSSLKIDGLSWVCSYHSWIYIFQLVRIDIDLNELEKYKADIINHLIECNLFSP